MTETASPTAAFTAEDAVETLSELGHYEERLTTRAAALTWMFFGVAGAAIFVTYEAAIPLFVGMGIPWLLSFLWAPWILAAAVLTNGLWSMLSLHTNIEHDQRETWKGTLGGVLLVFVLGFVVWAIVESGAVRLDPNAASAWAIIIGVFTAIFSNHQSRRYGVRVLRTPFLLAGGALLLTGFALALWRPEDPVSGLVAALMSLVSYFVAGTYVYRRG